MSTHQQGGPDGPGPQDPSWPVGAEDLWDADELDELLAHPCRAGRLGQVLSAAAAATTQAERQPGEEEALRAFRAAATVSRPGRGARLPVARLSGKGAAVALAGGLVLSGGAAAAATGALPGAAQQTARSVLARIGVNVPGPDAHAGGHPGVRGTSTHSPSGPAGRNATAPQDKPSSSDGRSAARSTATPGAGKGAAVSG
ncbi:MAG: hypothetical protein ACXV3C_09375, partial [Actinomycetes bacterium]